MRWDRLFDDLEGQLDAAEVADFAGEVADRTRRELARLRLDDRARAAIGATVTVGVGAAGSVSGRLARCGVQWWLLDGPGSADTLVPTGAITWVSGLPPRAADPDQLSAVEARLDLAHILRRLARDRAPVVLLLRDGSTVSGTLDRVGADAVDLAEHLPGEARRAAAVRAARTVPFAALAVVRSR